MNQNKFVFIIPSYNNYKWCIRNIKSLRKQNYLNWRAIYIDDASNDNTCELISRYIKKHNMCNKFTIIQNDKNYRN